MTDLLEQAIERVRTLSPEAQDDVARVMLAVLDDEPGLVVLDPGEKASFAKSLAQAARGEFASDERIRAIWAKHGL
ncbi:hypothetical protein NS228_23730 [Methylobacterium indicum]|uniref:hypothetical protein n=1 Tax=Methylobacterium indicum TaxID=1775910 RepID=UPI000733E281|nr:hypothetical protein [Methylobacterium indicum]KTS30730.1 hypothetical protein NS229_15265 [Methylobacterium indicum]KTS30756.1 hypothetical protein NS228_23730 [Methylobacterium indicum]KTS52035.1 hypothetical protein NS230_11935 [Methylobacterium indicum]